MGLGLGLALGGWTHYSSLLTFAVAAALMCTMVLTLIVGMAEILQNTATCIQQALLRTYKIPTHVPHSTPAGVLRL